MNIVILLPPSPLLLSSSLLLSIATFSLLQVSVLDPVVVVAMAYRLEEIIPNSTLTIIEECGHYPMIEKGEEWTNHIISYLHNIDHT